MTEKKTVLIAEDDSVMAQALKRRCWQLGLEVKVAGEGAEALQILREDKPDLLISDIDMPVMDGISLCTNLIEDSSIEPLPVIVLTGSSDPSTIRRCVALGTHYIFKDYNLWPKLKTLITSLLEEEPEAASAPVGRISSAPKVLIVDDDKELLEALEIRLRSYGVETITATNGMQGYWTAIRVLPDVILTDFKMPQGSGDHMIVRLRDFTLTQEIPILVMSGRQVDGTKNRALERDMVGRRRASFFFHKPFEFAALIEELENHITITRRPSKKRSAMAREAPLPVHQDLAEG